MNEVNGITNEMSKMNEVNGITNGMSKMNEVNGMKTTSEQDFLFMLKDRIDRLEDELLRLEKRITTRFHRWECQSIESKEQMLNRFFQDRVLLDPVFAAWYWNHHDDQTFLNLVVVTQVPHPPFIFQDLPGTYTPIPDLYTFIQYIQTYFHNEDEGDTHYPYEYWHRYHGALHGYTQSEWTSEPFLVSQNVSLDPVYQRLLRSWIFTNPNWADILRIFY